MKKQFSVNDVVKLLHRQPAHQKKQQLQRRLVAFIMAPTEVLGKVQRIMAVATAIQQHHDQNRQVATDVWLEFSHAICSNDQVSIFLMFLEHYEYQTRHTSPLQQKALARVSLEFHRFVGATLDRSISYALVLLEQYTDLLQKSYTGTSELTQGTLGPLACKLIATAAATPEHVTIPVSGWFHKILRANVQNPTARDILSSLLSVLTSGGMYPIAWQVCDERVNPLVWANIDSNALLTAPVITVHQDELSYLESYLDQVDASNQPLQEAGENLLTWYRLHRAELEEKQKAKATAILEKPRRGLRPGGLDHIEIHLSPLHNAGVRSIVLYPEGHTFPNLRVDIVVMKVTMHMVTFTCDMFNLKLSLPKGVLENSAHPDQEELKALLEYSIIDTLHWIIAEEREQRAKKSSKGQASASGNKSVAVRPHLRRLQVGQEASQSAHLQAAKDMGWQLPTGMTFVRCYYRNGELQYDLSTEPIATYTDADMMEEN